MFSFSVRNVSFFIIFLEEETRNASYLSLTVSTVKLDLSHCHLSLVGKMDDVLDSIRFLHVCRNVRRYFYIMVSRALKTFRLGCSQDPDILQNSFKVDGNSSELSLVYWCIDTLYEICFKTIWK